MNEKFFSLSKEKQNSIINAGFRIFSQNSYNKSPVSEIAQDAGISKALLFHYFRNKQELYIFLWNKAANLTQKACEESNIYQSRNLFDMMEIGIKFKTKLINTYPHMSNFLVKAYYEKDIELRNIIHKNYDSILESKAQQILASLDPEDYIPGLDLKMMYRDMYLASKGYMWEMLQKGDIDCAKLEEDSYKLLAFWRNIYENPAKRTRNNKSSTNKGDAYECN